MIIPARYASSRLPGKPLLELGGRPMIQRVYEQAASSTASRVIVATDDQRIAAAAANFGAEVCLTRPDHRSGTERLAEVILACDLPSDELVVNVQGDEPFLPPENIDQVARNLAARPAASVATLAEPVPGGGAQVHDTNAVKVVTDRDGYALYFSRAAIPWARDGFDRAPQEFVWQRHLGIYAYRARFVLDYVSWPACPPEQLEALEQLRVLWYGHRIHVDLARHSAPGGIDTAQDYERARKIFE